jgi:ADP-ribose pyrophosphatase YjhB (NUDIX family)
MESRRYPKFPIPGVGAIVIGEKGILLARRDKPPGTGLWSIPGGGVEVGETQEESVIREVKEETGIQCSVIKFVTTADLITLDADGKVEYHFLLNHYLARALTQDTRPEFSDGEVGWFHPNDLPRDMVNPELVKLIESQKESILKLMKE